jgi:hypothetical protein
VKSHLTTWKTYSSCFYDGLRSASSKWAPALPIPFLQMTRLDTWCPNHLDTVGDIAQLSLILQTCAVSGNEGRQGCVVEHGCAEASQLEGSNPCVPIEKFVQLFLAVSLFPFGGSENAPLFHSSSEHNESHSFWAELLLKSCQS